MPRVKSSKVHRKRAKKVLKAAKGFWGAKSKWYRAAKEALLHAGQYAYRDRRMKKRTFRSLWIMRINAASRLYGLTYSRLIAGLKKAQVKIDRKMLADLAVNDQKAFAELAKLAQEQIQKEKEKKET